jgi:hypothetical protein
VWKRYLLYLVRWQLSTPILALVLVWFAFAGNLVATVIANFIGGLMFFWVDHFIFNSEKLGAVWSVKDNVVCADCGVVSRGYRLVKTKGYDKTGAAPEFRCEKCSIVKSESLKKKGINTGP